MVISFLQPVGDKLAVTLKNPDLSFFSRYLIREILIRDLKKLHLDFPKQTRGGLTGDGVIDSLKVPKYKYLTLKSDVNQKYSGGYLTLY